MTDQMSLSRRQVLAASSLLLMSGACSGASAPSGKIKKVGIQTYTLREAFGEDFVGTFQMIKDTGYDYVELNGRNLSEHSPQQLREILDSVGLPAPAMHMDYDTIENHTGKLADVMQVLGCKYVVLPWLDEGQRSLDDYKRHADMLNRSGEILGKSGLRLAYHNHQFEFFDLGDGVNGMDILLNETAPEYVDFELDFFWSELASVDIPQLFRQHPGRFKLCHIKDLAGDREAWVKSNDYGQIVSTLMKNVGEGTLPFETYFALNEISGMEYFIAEHDNPPKPFQTSIETSLNTIRAMRF